MDQVASHSARTFHSQYGFRPIKLLEETCRIATCRRVRPHCDNVPMWFLQLPSLRILDVLVMDWRNQYLQTRHLHGCFPVIGTAVGVDQARPIPTLVVQAGLRIIVGHILAFLASHISYGGSRSRPPYTFQAATLLGLGFR